MIELHDLHPNAKLGRLAPKANVPIVPLEHVFDVELPLPDSTGNRAGRIGSWPMLLNDQLSDCGPAAAAHLLRCARFLTGRQDFNDISDDDVRQFYFEVTGGQDSGVVMTDMFDVWQKHGLKGDKLIAYLRVDMTNMQHVRAAINYLGGVLVGVSLPIAAKALPVWDIPPNQPLVGPWQPSSWGDHAIYVPDFALGGPARPWVFPDVTWGAVKLMTSTFLSAFGEEGYAVVVQDYMSNGRSPEGLDVARLERLMADVSTLPR